MATQKKQKAKKLSGLDAAYQVLAGSKQPLTSKEIVDAAIEAKLWQTQGQTPQATIYAAILRDIQTNGTKSRFRKAAPGKFAITKRGRNNSGK